MSSEASMHEARRSRARRAATATSGPHSVCLLPRRSLRSRPRPRVPAPSTRTPIPSGRSAGSWWTRACSARACSPWGGTRTRSPRPASSSCPHPSTPPPRCVGAYLVTDDDVARTVARFAGSRPGLDDVSLGAILPGTAPQPPSWDISGDAQDDAGEPEDIPESHPDHQQLRTHSGSPPHTECGALL
jgi:hypothetical protein